MGLDPAVAAVRLAVRRSLRGDPALVACSGGADSLALLAAAVFEGRKVGTRVIAAVVDHGLQPGSPEVATTVARWLTDLGLDPVTVHAVEVSPGGEGVEAAARTEA